MANGENTPIIIKKKKAGHRHHGGAWKVAYADFVTAMMALFIVLWVLSQDESVIESVSRYFKDPVGFTDKGRSMIEGKAPVLVDPEMEIAQQKKEIEKQELKNMGEKILTELSEDPNFINVMDQIKIEITDEGLKIELIESSDDMFFEIGTAKLNEKTTRLLTLIAQQLVKIPNKIVIEGHTDARPYIGDGTGYTNYELSADRANSARRVLVVSGITAERINEIRGYADRKLRDPDDPYSMVNRRISIIVKYL